MGNEREPLTPGQVRLSFWLALAMTVFAVACVVWAVVSPNPWVGLIMALAFGVQAPYQWMRYFRRRP
ncbi:hypothetical protein [Amycolatopsis thermoflava]|uniref:hypothetical protein n=1 Tax=Amycolatopsis thermoflava TaxID=84480 RepID=UPI00380C1E3E